MSLFTFTASATHTATTNETINNTVIINFLSLIFNLLSCLSFDDAKVRLFSHTAKHFCIFLQKNQHSFDINQAFVCEHTEIRAFFIPPQ